MHARLIFVNELQIAKLAKLILAVNYCCICKWDGVRKVSQEIIIQITAV